MRRAIHLAQLEILTPVLLLTREATRAALPSVTVAPISDTIRGLCSEVPVGPENGLERVAVVNLDQITTVPTSQLGRRIGYLLPDQEEHLAEAMVNAFDLDLPIFR